MDDTSVPFIQANSMERIISLLENLYGNPMTPGQIAELMDFDPRQSDYYYNAGAVSWGSLRRKTRTVRYWWG